MRDLWLVGTSLVSPISWLCSSRYCTVNKRVYVCVLSLYVRCLLHGIILGRFGGKLGLDNKNNAGIMYRIV